MRWLLLRIQSGFAKKISAVLANYTAKRPRLVARKRLIRPKACLLECCNMDDPILKLLREAIRAALKEELELYHVLRLADGQLEDRHLRFTEIEWAWRIRRAFVNGDIFMSAQGAGADRDIVSHDAELEIEVKYFGSEKPQGGKIPLADWKWLAGMETRKSRYRKPNAKYRRVSIIFFPRAISGCRIQRIAQKDNPGKWMFTDCLSFTPDDIVPLCFRQFTDRVVPKSKTTGRDLQARLQFIKPVSNPAILQCNDFTGFSEVIGDSFNDPFWAIFQIELPQISAGAAFPHGLPLLT
jgi:hypothetical protein